MKTWVRKALTIGALAAGALLFAPSAAHADTQMSFGNDGIANGNQIHVPVQIPINVCGNGVGVLGIGTGLSGACVNEASHDADGKQSHRTSGNGHSGQVSRDNDGILNGNQIQVPIQVPVNVCGNGIGVLGLGTGVSGVCANDVR
jgi:ChpA-C